MLFKPAQPRSPLPSHGSSSHANPWARLSVSPPPRPWRRRYTAARAVKGQDAFWRTAVTRGLNLALGRQLPPPNTEGGGEPRWRRPQQRRRSFCAAPRAPPPRRGPTVGDTQRRRGATAAWLRAWRAAVRPRRLQRRFAFRWKQNLPSGRNGFCPMASAELATGAPVAWISVLCGRGYESRPPLLFRVFSCICLDVVYLVWQQCVYSWIFHKIKILMI